MKGGVAWKEGDLPLTVDTIQPHVISTFLCVCCPHVVPTFLCVYLQALANILLSLTTMHPMDLFNVAEGFSQPPEKHLYIRVRGVCVWWSRGGGGGGS